MHTGGCGHTSCLTAATLGPRVPAAAGRQQHTQADSTMLMRQADRLRSAGMSNRNHTSMQAPAIPAAHKQCSTQNMPKLSSKGTLSGSLSICHYNASCACSSRTGECASNLLRQCAAIAQPALQVEPNPSWILGTCPCGSRQAEAEHTAACPATILGLQVPTAANIQIG